MGLSQCFTSYRMPLGKPATRPLTTIVLQHSLPLTFSENTRLPSAHLVAGLFLLACHRVVGSVGGVDGPVGALTRVVFRPRHLLEALVEREVVSH